MSIPVQQVEQIQLVEAPEAPATVTVYTAEKLQRLKQEDDYIDVDDADFFHDQSSSETEEVEESQKDISLEEIATRKWTSVDDLELALKLYSEDSGFIISKNGGRDGYKQYKCHRFKKAKDGCKGKGTYCSWGINFQYKNDLSCWICNKTRIELESLKHNHEMLSKNEIELLYGEVPDSIMQQIELIIKKSPTKKFGTVMQELQEKNCLKERNVSWTRRSLALAVNRMKNRYRFEPAGNYAHSLLLYLKARKDEDAEFVYHYLIQGKILMYKYILNFTFVSMS